LTECFVSTDSMVVSEYIESKELSDSMELLRVGWCGFSIRLRTLSASFDVVADAQLALEITFGREVVLFAEVVLETEVEKLFVTFFASLCDRSLARELMLVLLGELCSLVVMTCSLSF
jgi:hypothetical protein